MNLILIFDNGIDPDPAFSGSILGKIFVDDSHNFCLATWPLHQDKNLLWRKEVLFPHVESFEFEFLGENATEHGKKEAIKPINATLAWRTHWPKSPQKMPSIVRLKIEEEKEKEPLQFAFILPASSELDVIYRGKAS